MDTDEYRAQILKLDQELSDLYRRRREVMEAFSSEHPAVLPAARQQTDVQRRVARCPRCGGKLDSDVPPPRDSGIETPY